MNNKTYFITLRPYQLYFFGKEQEEVADYYLKGNPLPQQTALFGMVRYQILKQNGQLDAYNKVIDSACDWIGEKSFQYDNEWKFGKIISMSPCYIVRTDNNDTKKYLPTCLEFFDILKKLGDNYFLPHYDPKKEYLMRWINITDKNDVIVNFYNEIERPGVDKNYAGKTEEDSFYKQVWFKMEEGFSFGFYLTVSGDVKIGDADVNLGKENSAFCMKVTEDKLPEDECNKDDNALVLTSDAYVDPSFFEKCDFSVCNTVPFRNLTNTTNSIHNHYKLHKNSKRIQLLERGSVFITQDIDSLMVILKNKTNFRNVGYNSFQTTKIEII
jgi:CRISPR-associated protein Cmr3